MDAADVKVLRGRVLSFSDEPASLDDAKSYRYIEDGAVVIGGGSLNGGRGSVLGTMAGAVMMQAIASGCTILELDNPIQDILIGVIIITAVTIDQLRQWRKS